MVHGADKVCREHKAALKYWNNNEINWIARGDFPRNRVNLGSDVLGREQHADSMTVDIKIAHGRAFEPISPVRANRFSVSDLNGGRGAPMAGS